MLGQLIETIFAIELVYAEHESNLQAIKSIGSTVRFVATVSDDGGISTNDAIANSKSK